MYGVKRSNALLPGFIAVFAVSTLAGGCANSDLARFAPPGLIKYEEIAGDQPVNPEVAARVAERRSEPDTGKFPKLSETPGAAERPKKKPPAQVDADMAELSDARDRVEDQIAEDWAAAEADMEEATGLPDRRDELKDRVDRDTIAAARERRDRLAPPEEK